jgi:PII-like signaling protein
MNEPIKMLIVFLNEVDRWNGEPLHGALMRRLGQLGVAGATAHKGTMGFGHHHRLHHEGLFGISDDRPITITVVDAESKIRALLPEVRSMVREGLILMLDAELVADPIDGGSAT